MLQLQTSQPMLHQWIRRAKKRLILLRMRIEFCLTNDPNRVLHYIRTKAKTPEMQCRSKKKKKKERKKHEPDEEKL
jgi:hypothetical protein